EVGADLRADPEPGAVVAADVGAVEGEQPAGEGPVAAGGRIGDRRLAEDVYLLLDGAEEELGRAVELPATAQVPLRLQTELAAVELVERVELVLHDELSSRQRAGRDREGAGQHADVLREGEGVLELEVAEAADQIHLEAAGPPQRFAEVHFPAPEP